MKKKEWRIEHYTYVVPHSMDKRRWHYWKDNSHLPFKVNGIMTLETGVKTLYRLHEHLNRALTLRLHNERTGESIPADIL